MDSFIGGCMVRVSVHEAKTNLSSLIALVERNGENIIIERHGRAVAEICPVAKKSRIVADPILKKIVITCDLTSPTEEEWENV